MCRCAAAIARVVVEFLEAVILGCLRSCFRGARPRRGSGRRDALAHRDRDRAAEFVWDEEGLVRGGRFHEELADGGGTDEELRREASYLKLCGAISETPAELRSEQSNVNNLEDTNECDDNKPTSGPPANCNSLFEAVSSEGFKEPHSLKCELSEPNTEDAGHHHGVEFVPHSASSEKRLFQNVQQKPLDSSGSPFPTPQALRDDMQTPGTAYASHRGTSISAKRVRTRKQFIYPVLRSIENKLQQTEPTENPSPLASFSNPLKGRNLQADSIKDPIQKSSTSVVKSGTSETSSYPPTDANASYEVQEALSSDELLDGKGLPKSNSDQRNAALILSHLLNSSSTEAVNQGDVECPTGECNFVSEGPIFVASDLNLDISPPTPRLPKAWDGNGIPNTTTRYKEDQRVNWHTTPFEDRLLKVLSDEERYLSRKVVEGSCSISRRKLSSELSDHTVAQVPN